MDPMGRPTLSAHPARFSPDDKFSKQRVVLKKRFGLLPTQQPKEVCWRKTKWTDLTITWKYWTKRRLSWWHCWHFPLSVYFVQIPNSQFIYILIVNIFILSEICQIKSIISYFISYRYLLHLKYLCPVELLVCNWKFSFIWIIYPVW